MSNIYVLLYWTYGKGRRPRLAAAGGLAADAGAVLRTPRPAARGRAGVRARASAGVRAAAPAAGRADEALRSGERAALRQLERDRHRRPARAGRAGRAPGAPDRPARQDACADRAREGDPPALQGPDRAGSGGAGEPLGRRRGDPRRDPQPRSFASSVTAVSEALTRTRGSANGSSRRRAIPSSTVTAAL